MNIKAFLLRCLRSGIQQKSDPLSSQKVVVANIFSLLGCSITLTLGIIHALNNNYILSIAIFIVSSIYLLAHLIFRYNWISIPYRTSANLLTLSTMLLVIYLLYSGGVKGTGPLWIYVVPSVTLFFGGINKGGRNLLLFLTVVCVQLFSPEQLFLDYTYSYEFKTRLIFSFVTISVLFAVYEAARQSSYQRVIAMSNKFQQQAMYDPLSGLHNRRGMKINLEKEYSRSKRNHFAMTVMMCDIDHFKLVNDKYGHDKGDEVIKTVAEIFSTQLREQDSLARWGGEEYLFLLPMTSGKQSLILAEKLRKKIESVKFSHKQAEFNITVSIGIHQFRAIDTIEHAISMADSCLYQAKSDGRNRCVIQS